MSSACQTPTRIAYGIGRYYVRSTVLPCVASQSRMHASRMLSCLLCSSYIAPTVLVGILSMYLYLHRVLGAFLSRFCFWPGTSLSFHLTPTQTAHKNLN
ncbi:hypothetical protein LX36DRAFT_213281 [Colletotrichum falcatum]|nr:hypothetical protein LX36DRAFT_213281 [Colletotrichum falcatum]